MKTFFCKKAKSNDEQRSISLSYCDLEMKAVMLAVVGMTSSLTFAFTVAIPLFPNKFWLPLNFCIAFLPFKEVFSVNWFLNYTFQVIFPSTCTVFYVAYIPALLIEMNHSCWMVEVITCNVETLKKNRRTVSVDKKLRDIVEMVSSFMTWQMKAVETLKFNFLLEFSMLSVMLGFCMKSMAKDFFYSYPALMGLCVLTSQLFVYGWLGSRLKTRFDKLSEALFNADWESMSAFHRKDLRMVLMMSQRLKSFHGIFKLVELATVQDVSGILKFFRLI